MSEKVFQHHHYDTHDADNDANYGVTMMSNRCRRLVVWSQAIVRAVAQISKQPAGD